MAGRLSAIYPGAVLLAILAPTVVCAQVWATGPNGVMGYISAPVPISPNCVPPAIWMQQPNGAYTCGVPAPPPPPPPPPANTPPPPAIPLDQTCAASLGISLRLFDGEFTQTSANTFQFGPNLDQSCGDVETDICTVTNGVANIQKSEQFLGTCNQGGH